MSGSTSPFSKIYSFGDSLSDAGNVSLLTSITGSEPVSPPYYSQNYGIVSGSEFSNGQVWVQRLSTQLGLGTLSPSLTGGNDFAYGGAETGSTPQNKGDTTTAAISVPAQLTQFETQVGKGSSTALYTLSIGANDILDILSKPTLSLTDQQNDVTVAVNNEVADITRLASDGAKTFAILEVPNLGLTPDVLLGAANGSNTGSAGLTTLATYLSVLYDVQLYAGVAAAAAKAGFSFTFIDAYNLLGNAVANPSAYGLSNATSPVWTGNYTDSKSGTLAATTKAAQDQYLYFDKLHPTEAGHAAIANLAQSFLSPSYALQIDQTTNVSTPNIAQAYFGPDLAIHSQFANITTDNVAIFGTASGMFITSGSGNDILVAQSGVNVLDAGQGSNFLVGGTGTNSSDSFYVNASGGANSWNDILNFHAGDALTVVGFNPGVSKTTLTADASGTTLHIDLTGGGTLFANDTFLGVSLSDAQKFTLTPGTAGSQSFLTVSA